MVKSSTRAAIAARSCGTVSSFVISIGIDFSITRSCWRGMVGYSRVLRYSSVICALMNPIVVVVAIISTGYRRLISADSCRGDFESRSRINSSSIRMALYLTRLTWKTCNLSSDLLTTSSSANLDALSTSACFCARAINKATSSTSLSSVFRLRCQRSKSEKRT